jgi:tripartite-type tricarboxylate transporter receptor subunit TctC
MEMDRPILLPPGAPKDIVAALRKAFHETMIDPAFIAEADRQHLEIQEIDGDRIATLLKTALSLPPDVVKAANEAMALTGAANE